MKKKLCAGIALCASLLLVGGCGKIPKLSNGDDAVVTFKDDQKISVNDLYNKLKDNYALESLVTMIDTHILETEFADKIDEAKKYAENNIKAMIEQYGDETKLLQALQYYTNYSTVEAYQEYVYISYLQSQATTAYAKSLITDKQIETYYNDTLQGDIEVSHILITSDAASDATDDEKKAAEEKAKATATEVIDKLKEAQKAGKDITEEFSNLAKEYSKDSATKDKGGSLGKINSMTLASTYDELVTAAYKLVDGTFTTGVVTTEQGYEVILRTKSYEKDTLDNLKDSIKEKIATQAISDDNTMGIDALQYYRKNYETAIQDSELQKQYEKYIRNVIDSYENQKKES